MNKESFSQIQAHFQPEQTILYSTAYLCAWCHFHPSRVFFKGYTFSQSNQKMQAQADKRMTSFLLPGVTVLCGCDVSTVRSSCWRWHLSMAKFKSIGLWGLASEKLEKIAKRGKLKEGVNFHYIYTQSHLVQMRKKNKNKNQSHPSALLFNKTHAADPIMSTQLSSSGDVLTPAQLASNRWEVSVS